MDSSVQVRYGVLMEGQVMNLNFCQLVAPSTAAASYISLGMASRPEMRIRVQNGSDFQMCTATAMLNAIAGLLSQFGPSRPENRKISELTIPHSGLNMNLMDKMVGIDGVAHGRRTPKASHLLHCRASTKKPTRTARPPS